MFACRTGWGYCEVNPSGLPSPFPVCDSFEFRVAGGQNGYTSHKVCTCLCQPFGFTLSLPARLLASQALKPGEMAHSPLSEKKHRKKKEAWCAWHAQRNGKLSRVQEQKAVNLPSAVCALCWENA